MKTNPASIITSDTITRMAASRFSESSSVPGEAGLILLNAKIADFLRKKLKAMDLEVCGLELHNSSQTKTWRAYITLKRAINLKAACMAEQILTAEVEREFAFRPHAFYWRYKQDNAD